MNKRIGFIDIAKGIGILLVVLAHNDLQAYAPFLHKVIYSFHMPLFFFLSGMFFRPETPFWQLIRKRFDSLLKPYFFTLIFIYFAAVFFGNMGFPVAFSRLAKSLYANGFTLDWVAMWFLPALFTMNLVAFGFYRLLGETPLWARLLALTAMLTIGLLTLDAFMPFSLPLFGKSLTLNGLPWSLDLALVAGFFFILGRETNTSLPEKFYASPWLLAASAALALTLLILSPATIDLNTRLWESPLINSLEALAGIAFVLALSYQLERSPAWLGNFFRYMGQISIVLLIFHNPVQSYLTPKFDAMFGVHPLNPLLAYPFAVLVPVIIAEVFIRPSALLAKIYGVK
ncbi:MAG: acyltransferase family protein [Anaerolineales bacterium]